MNNSVITVFFTSFKMTTTLIPQVSDFQNGNKLCHFPFYSQHQRVSCLSETYCKTNINFYNLRTKYFKLLARQNQAKFIQFHLKRFSIAHFLNPYIFLVKTSTFVVLSFLKSLILPYDSTTPQTKRTK